MFKHQGDARTFRHNLHLASLLSFVAGLVNVAGLFSVQKLTTNVTGHFAFFVDEIFKLHFWNALHYFLFIFFFFLWSFAASFSVELSARLKFRNAYYIPILAERLLLIIVAFFGSIFIQTIPNTLVYILLFSMGRQNSLVTTISNASVRTPHLTGLFTDLGIELSQFIARSKNSNREKLITSIKLRLTIISFFFLGGFLGGVLYTFLELKVLLVAVVALLIGLVYDDMKQKLTKHSKHHEA